jgi:hypothetical protein
MVDDEASFSDACLAHRTPPARDPHVVLVDAEELPGCTTATFLHSAPRPGDVSSTRRMAASLTCRATTLNRIGIRGSLRVRL